jgi:hypothetical protein
MYALLDQMAAAVGVAATPDFQWVYLLAAALVRCFRAARRRCGVDAPHSLGCYATRWL